MLPEKFTSDKISFLADSERGPLKEEISAKYREIIRAKGAYIIVRPYISPKQTVGGIILAASYISEDKFHSQICQVIDVGPLAYTSDKFTGQLSWCEVGDWVVVPRNTGARIVMSNSEDDDCLRIILEHEILAVVKDPKDFLVKISATKY